MMRTLASISIAAFAGCSAFGSFDALGGGSGMLNAGGMSEAFNVPVPSSVNVALQDPTIGCFAIVQGGATSSATSFGYELLFQGQGSTGVASSQFSTQISLTTAADFLMTGTLAGLAGYDLRFRPLDNSFMIREYLDYDDLGFFGTLVDDFEQPVPHFTVQGILGPGSYELTWTIRAESIGNQPYNGAGGFHLRLTTVPTPSTLLAIALPGAFALRRRR